MELITLTVREEDGEVNWDQAFKRLIPVNYEQAKIALGGYAVYYLTEYGNIDYTTWWHDHIVDGHKRTHYIPKSEQYYIAERTYEQLKSRLEEVVNAI